MDNVSKPEENYISRKSKNVLIIDDEIENSDVITFFLDAHGIGYKWISDGRKGLDTIKNEGGDFDLILLDLLIPDFSGIDLFNNLLKNNQIKYHSIILFTASSVNQEVTDMMLNNGAKGLILKPPNLDTLEKMVEKYLS